ncbi:MAG: peptidoglycan DD-metalloendopeptidase family protein [Phormidesmis sp.]
MLGLALSVGASGALVSQAEASAAVSAPIASETTRAFSSDSQTSVGEAVEVGQEGSQSAQPETVAYHTVASGESLWQIAQQHRVGLRDLKFANNLPPETAIRVGQVLRVPALSASAQSGASLEAQEVFPTTQIVFEEVASASDPVLVARTPSTLGNNSDADFVASDPTAEELAVDTRGESVVGSKTIEQPVSIQIEITDASSIQSETQAELVPIVTTLAVSQPFDSYQVRSGDTLASISSSLGTTPEEIMNANTLANPNVIIAGTTLIVPTSSEQSTVSKTDTSIRSSSDDSFSDASSERLAHLQSTAARPEASRILGELRSASPATPNSVGGVVVAEQAVIGADAPNESLSEVQSADPYVANLLEDVQAVRETSVRVSEAATSESIASEIGSDNDRPSLLASSSEPIEEASSSEQIALAQPTSADAELLAAAPLSPDAYIPAQRPAAGQVVSPDMPILPGADEFLPEAPEYFNGYVWPTQGTVTSGFGWRWGRMHRGVDVAGPVGTPVVAAATGTVEQAGWNSGGYGNLVDIRHPDGSMTRYAHNSRLNVSAGQAVRQGQQIAEMGSTGYSTGPHLHFEVHVSGQGAVNPVAYLPGR